MSYASVEGAMDCQMRVAGVFSASSTSARCGMICLCHSKKTTLAATQALQLAKPRFHRAIVVVVRML